jgi:hypothetical protein
MRYYRDYPDKNGKFKSERDKETVIGLFVIFPIVWISIMFILWIIASTKGTILLLLIILFPIGAIFYFILRPIVNLLDKLLGKIFD